MIDHIQYEDRGEYVCYYSDKNYKENANSASVKVFVNDPDNLLSPQKIYYLPWCPDKPLIVPCMPTNSMVNITLWANGQTTGFMIHVNNITHFNPFEGFAVFVNHMINTIECIGELNNIISSPQIFTVHHSVPDAVPHISITSEPDRYALINGNITLTCSVNTPDIIFRPEWQNIQNETDQHATTQITVSKGSISNVLYIFNVEKYDENCYVCEIKTSCDKISEEICISIFETKPLASFNLSTHIDKPVVLKVDENLVLITYINIFPLDASDEVDFFWYKDGKQLESNDRVNISLNLPKKSTIKVSNLQLADRGIYTFAGNTSKESKNISIIVKIESKPKINITGLSYNNFYMTEERHVFFCDVEANPLPNVIWYWKSCNNYTSCDINWTLIESDLNFPNFDDLMQADISDVRRIHRLEITAFQTGYYKCIAENIHGIEMETMQMIVTDVEDGFKSKISLKSPVEFDNITIQCQANLFQYHNIRWEWFPIDEKNSFDIWDVLETNSNMNVSSKSTLYSHIIEIHFHPIYANNSGVYVCYGQSSYKDVDSINSSVSFVVKDIIKPILISTNLNGSKVTVKKNQEYQFFCYVKGIPNPIIQWYHNQQLLNKTESKALKFKLNNQRLLIGRVINTDAGLYECKAKNRGGQIVRNITLQVISDNKSEDNNFIISKVNIIIIICVLIVVIIFVIISIFGMKIYRNRKYQHRKTFINNSRFSEGQIELLNPELPLEEQAELLPYNNCWEFPKERLKLGVTLGQGVFGRVVKADAIGLLPNESSTTVAVKLLKEQADINQQKALMTELKILSHLGHHVNIVNLLGAVTKNLNKGELMVLVEYCRYGNLRHYLLYRRENFINQINPITGHIDIDTNDPPYLPPPLTDYGICKSIAVGVKDSAYRNRTASQSELLKDKNYSDDSKNESTSDGNASIISSGKQENKQITTCDLLCFSFQCARGMEYLASKNLLHRDLAARNVLVAEDNIIKICDFGLAKDLYEYGSYVKKGDGPLPIKWMAIESIRDKIFTTKSDVWSFGILLWEIFTLGRNPYPGIDLNEEFFKKLSEGYRMEKPEYSTDSLYEIMMDCWNLDPNNRPDFKSLGEKLGSLLEESAQQNYMDFNNSYYEGNYQLQNNGDSQNEAKKIENINKCESSYTDVKGKNQELMSKKNPKNNYDIVKTVKPINDNEITRIPMEIVPMIHLENEDTKEMKCENSLQDEIENSDEINEIQENS